MKPEKDDELKGSGDLDLSKPADEILMELEHILSSCSSPDDAYILIHVPSKIRGIATLIIGVVPEEENPDEEPQQVH